MVTPELSVIIPTFEREDLLEMAVGSVAAQEAVGPVEVIVVNDGPTALDAQRYASMNNRVTLRIVEYGQGAGPAAARNVAIDRAEGRYIAFLDDDDIFLPRHISAGCEVLDRDEADFVYLGAAVSDSRLAPPVCLPDDVAVKAYPYDYNVLLVVNYIHTGSVIVRNFRNSGVRFDESLEVCEDWDLWLALTSTLGYRVSFVDELTSVYHQMPSVRGLVSEAQLASPTRFATTREHVHSKWFSDDPQVLHYRAWMTAFEDYRSQLVARERRMPNLLFDNVLKYVHTRMAANAPADLADIPRFFS
ncbi:glycosyltransferase family 2 protein [Krasilnikovia sp. MM14-A1259]|uniref:glycosyltransferase family 2 protein n=1 Tax=Krasilnikovia sp. MM14-A1259 TaxID=3373539 RepID=UPI0038096956